VLLLGFALNLICDPAIIPLSRTAMKRNNKWKTTAQSLLVVVTKVVYPTQLLYLIQTALARSVGTYLPIFVNCTFCLSRLFSFFFPADFFQPQQRTDGEDDAAAAQHRQQPLLMPRKTVVDEVLNSQDLGSKLYHHNEDGKEGRA
jgi:hypothetical protein